MEKYDGVKIEPSTSGGGIGRQRRAPVVPLFEQALKGQLDDLEGDKLFSTNHARAKLAAEKAAKGAPVFRHSNGKIDLSVVLDENVAQKNVCRYCNHTFSYPHVMERHIKRIHEKHLMPKFQCPKCSYSSVWKDQLREHFSVIHQNFKPFFCTECSFRAPKPCRVTSHINRCHGGVGSCAFDSEMRPRSVSPTPRADQPIPKSCKRLSSKRPKLEGTSSEIVLQVDPSFFDQDFQETEIKFELIEDVKPEIGIAQEGKDITTKLEVIDVKPNIKLEPEVIEIDNDDDYDVDSSDSEDEFYFHCPFCSFKSKSQLGMGEHVIGTHESKNK